jgi:hypothetical protein
MLQASFDGAHTVRGSHLGSGADQELAHVVLREAVFQDADAVGFCRLLERPEPRCRRWGRMHLEDGDRPAEFVGDPDVGGGVNRVGHEWWSSIAEPGLADQSSLRWGEPSGGGITPL